VPCGTDARTSGYQMKFRSNAARFASSGASGSAGSIPVCAGYVSAVGRMVLAEPLA